MDKIYKFKFVSLFIQPKVLYVLQTGDGTTEINISVKLKYQLVQISYNY
jgi:hypothetical protein